MVELFILAGIYCLIGVLYIFGDCSLPVTERPSYTYKGGRLIFYGAFWPLLVWIVIHDELLITEARFGKRGFLTKVSFILVSILIQVIIRPIATLFTLITLLLLRPKS